MRHKKTSETEEATEATAETESARPHPGPEAAALMGRALAGAMWTCPVDGYRASGAQCVVCGNLKP